MVQIQGNAERKLRPMDEGTLKGILNAKVTNSLGYYGGKLSKARVTAMQYYQGEPFGNEQEGRSQVVSRDVAEAIDSMMPSLMRIFGAGEEIVRFDPTRPQSEESAKQATDYCNWIWRQQNRGFQIMFDWFKDAMLNRVGAIKIWWDTQTETAKEVYKGLTDEELSLLLQDAEDEEMEVLSHTSYPDPALLAQPAPIMPAPAPLAGATPGGAEPGLSPATQPLPPPESPNLHDIIIRRTNKRGRIKILAIPGEEFLMDRRAISLDETPFAAHRAKKTISDLVEMGFDHDLVKNLGEGDSSDFNLERLERFRQEDELPYRTGNNYDPSMKEVWVNECYLKVDFDGDGIAEMRKIVFAGESGNFAPGATVILSNEEIDDHPFAALTPVPMPHKFYGQSVADQTMDIQLIKSTLVRTALDHGYNAIMPQVAVIENQVNLDDLMTRRPGGIVRVKSQGAMTPIPAGELGVDPFQLIGYMDQVREQRTGVRRFAVGPGEDTLNNAYTETATGANLVENSTQERLELVARCFAEIGLAAAFRKILKLVSQNENRPRIIRLREKWVPIDPREWDDEYDMTVTVGIGTGNRAQQLQALNMLLQLDKEIIQLQQGLNGPLVTAENVFNKLAKVIEFIGLKSVEPYYTDPATAPPQQAAPQQPDPHVQAAQIKAQSDQQRHQGEMQMRMAEMQAEMQMRLKEMEVQGQIDLQKMHAQLENDLTVALAKIEAQRQMDFTRLQAQREEFNADAAMRLHEHASARSLEERQFGHQVEGDQFTRQQTVEQTARQDQERQAQQQQIAPPARAPRIKKLQLVRGKDGRASMGLRHYDDGTMDQVPIERLGA